MEMNGMFKNARRPMLLLALSFLLIGLAIYSNVIFRGIYLFDDFEYVVGNPMIESLSATPLNDPRQVGYLSFALNYAVGGDDARGYHLVNVIIHIANALLVFLLVQYASTALVKYDGGGQDAPPFVAYLASLFFLVHPLATQSVSYITQRFTSLATFFYLLAIVLYIISRLKIEAGPDGRSPYIAYAAALVAAVLAMRTKETAFTIPFALAGIEAVLFGSSKLQRRRFVFLIPFFATLVLIPLSLFGPELGLVGHDEGIAEITRREKIFDLLQRPAGEYLLTQFRVIIIYLKLLLLPVNQRVVYDLVPSRSIVEPFVILSFLVLVAIGAGAVYVWHVSSRRAPKDRLRYRMLSLGIAWFFLTISVESSFIPIKDLIFEHRTYLPSVGIFTVFAVIFSLAVDLIPDRMRSQRNLLILGIVAAFPFAIGTYLRNDIYTNELKFWDDVVRKNPAKAIGYHNRANAYAKLGSYDLALRDIDKTISFFPERVDYTLNYETSDFTSVNMAKTYMNRGAIFLDMGDQEQANRDFEHARKIASQPFVGTTDKLRLADAYAKKGAYRHAIEEYNKILQWDPENIEALNDRANAYSWTKNYREAIRDLSRIILLTPESALPYHNRGVALSWMGSRDKAVADFKKACGLGFKPACDSVAIAEQGKK